MARARRGRGEGSIHQRADGRWVGSVSFGCKPDGSRQRRWRSGDTKAEVLDKLNELRGEQDYGNADKLSFSEFVKRWLSTSVEHSTAGATLAGYRQRMRKHIEPVMGYLLLSKIGPIHIENLKASLRKKKLAATTQKNIFSVMAAAFEQAVMWKLIAVNPCNAVKPPKLVKREFKIFDAAQAEKLLTACLTTDIGPITAIALQSGARQGELLALEWRDVDWDKSSITIQRTVSDGDDGGELVIKQPKTMASRRTVDLTPGAMEILRTQRKTLMAAGLAACKLVFPGVDGGIMPRCTLLSQYYKMLAEAGLPRIRFHDLRHTHATLLLAEGISTKVIQERLGHSSIGITMGTYTHVLPRVHSEAVDRLGKLLG